MYHDQDSRELRDAHENDKLEQRLSDMAAAWLDSYVPNYEATGQPLWSEIERYYPGGVEMFRQLFSPALLDPVPQPELAPSISQLWADTVHPVRDELGLPDNVIDWLANQGLGDPEMTVMMDGLDITVCAIQTVLEVGYVIGYRFGHADGQRTERQQFRPGMVLPPGCTGHIEVEPRGTTQQSAKISHTGDPACPVHEPYYNEPMNRSTIEHARAIANNPG